MKCGTTNPVAECKKVEPKRESGATIQHGSKDQEIENIKRLLASVSQRLDALKTR